MTTITIFSNWQRNERKNGRSRHTSCIQCTNSRHTNIMGKIWMIAKQEHTTHVLLSYLSPATHRQTLCVLPTSGAFPFWTQIQTQRAFQRIPSEQRQKRFIFPFIHVNFSFTFTIPLPFYYICFLLLRLHLLFKWLL